MELASCGRGSGKGSASVRTYSWFSSSSAICAVVLWNATSFHVTVCCTHCVPYQDDVVAKIADWLRTKAATPGTSGRCGSTYRGIIITMTAYRALKLEFKRVSVFYVFYASFSFASCRQRRNILASAMTSGLIRTKVQAQSPGGCLSDGLRGIGSVIQSC